MKGANWEEADQENYVSLSNLRSAGSGVIKSIELLQVRSVSIKCYILELHSPFSEIHWEQKVGHFFKVLEI